MAFQNLTSGTVYLALGTALSATGVFTELTGTGYARQAITAQYDAVAGVIVFPAGVTFTAGGTWSASNYAAIFDSLNGGSLLMVWAAPGTALASGATLAIAAQAYNITVSASVMGPNKSVTNFTAIGSITGTSILAQGALVYSGVPIGMSATGVLSPTASSYSPLTQPAVVFRDVLDGGDMTVNPFQRNIPGLATAGVASAVASNTPVYFADRWFAVGGASSSITQAVVANTSLTGFNQTLQWGRTASNANTAPIFLGQVIEPIDVVRLQGQLMTLSFYALAGANFSGGTLTASVVSGTGNAANTTAANLATGAWTGATTLATSPFTLTTTAQRFQMTVPLVPANAVQLGVLFSYTPSGTAGASDNVQFFDIDLSLGSPASPAERRDIQLELELAQRFCWVIAEPANGVLVAPGTTTAANTQSYYLATPVQFRAAPTLTVATGSFKVAAGAAAALATISAGGTHTINAISLTSAVTAAAGVGALVVGGGGSGYVIASADY